MSDETQPRKRYISPQGHESIVQTAQAAAKEFGANLDADMRRRNVNPDTVRSIVDQLAASGPGPNIVPSQMPLDLLPRGTPPSPDSVQKKPVKPRAKESVRKSVAAMSSAPETFGPINYTAFASLLNTTMSQRSLTSEMLGALAASNTVHWEFNCGGDSTRIVDAVRENRPEAINRGDMPAIVGDIANALGLSIPRLRQPVQGPGSSGPLTR